MGTIFRASYMAAFVILFVLSGPVAAQDEPPGNQAEVWVVTVKDGMDSEFREAFKDHIKYRVRKNDPWEWRTYTPIIGDDLNHYVIRYCCTDHAGLDSYRQWTQEAKTGEHWNEKVDPTVASYRHYLQTVDFDNSNWPEGDPAFQLFGVTRYTHKMGVASSIEAGKTALSTSAKEGNWPRSWAWLRNTGGAGNLELVVPYMDYAEMAPTEESFAEFLARLHGADKAGEMLQSFSDNFTATDYTVYRYLPDMSMNK